MCPREDAEQQRIVSTTWPQGPTALAPKQHSITLDFEGYQFSTSPYQITRFLFTEVAKTNVHYHVHYLRDHIYTRYISPNQPSKNLGEEKVYT